MPTHDILDNRSERVPTGSASLSVGVFQGRAA
jgi:hypothetical protein